MPGFLLPTTTAPSSSQHLNVLLIYVSCIISLTKFFFFALLASPHPFIEFVILFLLAKKLKQKVKRENIFGMSFFFINYYFPRPNLTDKNKTSNVQLVIRVHTLFLLSLSLRH